MSPGTNPQDRFITPHIPDNDEHGDEEYSIPSSIERQGAQPSNLVIHPHSRRCRSPRQARPRTPRASTPGSNSSYRQVPSFDILRVCDVPHESTSIGAPTVRFRQSESSINAVTSGGYPVPDLPHDWYERIQNCTSPAPNKAVPVPYDTVGEWRNAILLFNNQEYDQSLAVFHTLIEHISTTSNVTIPHAQLYYNIGILQTIQTDLSAATRAFEQAIHHDPTLAIANYCLGVCIYKANKNDSARALSCFDIALSLFPARSKTINYSSFGLRLVLAKTVVNFARGLCESPVVACGGVGGAGVHRYSEMPLFNVRHLFEPDVVDGEEMEEKEQRRQRKEGKKEKVRKWWRKVKRFFTKN